MSFVNNNGHVLKCPICGNDDLSCRYCNLGKAYFNFYSDNYYYDCSCGGVVVANEHFEEHDNSKPSEG